MVINVSSETRTRVLVVEDDETVAEVVRRYLEREGYDVHAVADGRSALARFDDFGADLVVLDIMLPGIDGLEVCRQLRSRSPVPVIMLTALGEESDRIMGLEIGADDYISKPFSPRELVARIKSVLRRAGGPLTVAPHLDVLEAGGLVVEVPARAVTIDGKPITLTVREFDLLVFLMSHPRQVFTREDLLERVWGYTFGDKSTVTVHVRRLREKIEADPSDPEHLSTVWGVGYRFDP
jgi:DNA-binding response OmpR family regulator